MTTSPTRSKAGELAPALFPFITLRQEATGGILFNPYLAAERELDPIEARLAAMCDGTRTAAELVAECGAECRLSPEAAAERWDRTLAILHNASAVRFVGRKHARRARGRLPAAVPSSLPFATPKSVIWDVTYACNLTCPHCLTDSGRRGKRELTTPEAFRLIGALSAAKVLYLSISGGEPFARGDILQLLARLADTGMRVNVATNGVHVPRAMVKAVAELPVFHVQVSIDGIGAEHDRFRGRQGAFERACETLRRFREAGLSTSISTTATSRNIDRLGEIVDLAVELGCDAFKAIPFIPAGRGTRNESGLRLDRAGSMKLTKTLAEKSVELAGRIRISMESTYQFLLDPPPASISSDGRMICSAGYDELSIGADGTAYPCPFLRDLPLGNVLADSIETIWRDSFVLNELRGLQRESMNGACRTCTYATEYCRGGCRASAFLVRGDLRDSDPLCFKDLQAGEGGDCPGPAHPTR